MASAGRQAGGVSPAGAGQTYSPREGCLLSPFLLELMRPATPVFVSCCFETLIWGILCPHATKKLHRQGWDLNLGHSDSKSSALSPTPGGLGQHLAQLLPLFSQPHEVGRAGPMAPVDSLIREVKPQAPDHTARILWTSAWLCFLYYTILPAFRGSPVGETHPLLLRSTWSVRGSRHHPRAVRSPTGDTQT